MYKCCPEEKQRTSIESKLHIAGLTIETVEQPRRCMTKYGTILEHIEKTRGHI